jgi:hypothetical protein
VFCQSIPVPTQPVLRRARIFCTDVGNALAANLYEVLGRHLAYAQIIGTYEIGFEAREVAVE